MSEEKDTSVDKQEELKEKLKDMGVMQDDSEATTSSAETKSTSADSKLAFVKSQWPVLLAIVAVMVFGWMFVFSEDAQQSSVSDSGAGSTPATSPYSYQTPGYPPPPYPRKEKGEMPGAPSADSYQPPGFAPPPYAMRERGVMPPLPPMRGYPPRRAMPSEQGAETSQGDTASTVTPPSEPWADPMHRGDDRFGPPPGWDRFEPPPRRPRYYGPPSPYDGRSYFGPPPGWDPYGPPPGYYGPPPGYYPGY